MACPRLVFMCLLCAGIVENNDLPARGASATRAESNSLPRPDIVLGTFEGKTLDSWTSMGTAFDAAPFHPGAKGHLTGYEGTGMVWSGRSGLTNQGTLRSPEFVIQRKHLNFLVAGERNWASVLGVELLVGSNVVRAASASEANGIP